MEGDHFILFDDLKDTRVKKKKLKTSSFNLKLNIFMKKKVTVGYEKSGQSSSRNCAVYVKKGRRLVFVDFCSPASPLLAASKIYGVWVQKNRIGLQSIRESPTCPIIAVADEDSEHVWQRLPKYIGNFKCARLQGSNNYDTYLVRN